MFAVQYGKLHLLREIPLAPHGIAQIWNEATLIITVDSPASMSAAPCPDQHDEVRGPGEGVVEVSHGV